MTDSTDPKPELEIKSDADWKQRVKTEAAQFDAQHPQQDSDSTEPTSTEAEQPAPEEPPQAASAVGIDSAQFPPADFKMLVTMFSTQAMVALGVIPNPADGKAESNLGLARHFIDLLGILDEKTRGNLTEDESHLLEQSLHELRMAYVELSRAEKSSSS